jgi:hypothetical protein
MLLIVNQRWPCGDHDDDLDDDGGDDDGQGRQASRFFEDASTFDVFDGRRRIRCCNSIMAILRFGGGVGPSVKASICIVCCNLCNPT